jgi:NADPH:quinone reductase
VRAWQVGELGVPADVLELVDRPEPVPGPGELLVRVDACALNFPDVLMCEGKYQEQPPLPFTPGLEVCGTTADGRRLIGAPTTGGLAERALLRADAAYEVPAGMPADEAAALMITYQTAYVGLHRRAALRPGEWLLVHAGAGGVGSAAIQVGLAAGARVIATAGGPEKAAVCRDLGAQEVIDYSAEDVVGRVKDVTAGHGADVIWDPVGGDVFDASRRCVAFEGRLVVVGFAGGRIPAVPAGHVLVKNYSVVGLHWGLYRRADPAVITETHARLLELYGAGLIRPLVSDRVPMDGVPAALTRLASRGSVGKLVVVP